MGSRELRELEPELAEGFAGGMYYPQDHQVQPMLAAAMLLRRGRAGGRVQVVTGCAVRQVLRDKPPRIGALAPQTTPFYRHRPASQTI